MNAESDLEHLRAGLAQLPLEAPPPSLWLALQAAHAERYPRRRPQRWRYAAAAVLVLALLPVFLPREPPPAPPGVDPVAVDAANPGARAAALRVIDRQLQQGYLQGASDEELAPLWRRREELQRNQAPASAPTIRI